MSVFNLRSPSLFFGAGGQPKRDNQQQRRIGHSCYDRDATPDYTAISVGGPFYNNDPARSLLLTSWLLLLSLSLLPIVIVDTICCPEPSFLAFDAGNKPMQ